MSLTTTQSKTQSLRGNKKAAMSQGTPNPETSFNLMDYFKGVRQEWSKVTWPSRPQVIAETGVVLVVVTIFSLFVFLVDKLFQLVVQWIT